MNSRSPVEPGRFSHFFKAVRVSAVLVIGLLIAPVAAVPSSVSGDLLISGSIGDAMILNPILLGDSASSDIVSKVFNGLLKYDPGLKLVGDLAESYETSADGLSITFELRRGVRWHDGAPFSARDVKFTFDTIMHPETRTPYRSSFEKVRYVEILGFHRVRVVYSEPFAPALSSWTIGILPEHLLSGKDVNTAGFNRSPVGTGPFAFKEWRTNEKIVLVANPDYFEGAPLLRGYVARVIPDQPVQFLELQAGNIDLCGLTDDLYETRAAEPRFLKRFHRFRYPSFGYAYVGYNLGRALFKDRRVRLALTYAIDRRALISGLLRGHGTEITGPFLPEASYYNASVEALPYDPQKALDLLAEAGWSRTLNGDLVNAGGKIFKFTIITNQGNSLRAQCATGIQWMLKKIGMKVDVRIVAWPTFIAEFVNKRKFDAVLLGWSLDVEPDQYDIWHSSKTGEHEYNFVGYANDSVDRLLVEGRRTFSPKRRDEIYRRVHELIARDAPYTFLYRPQSLVALDCRFEGVKPTAIGLLYNIHEWYVPEGKGRYVISRD